MSEIRSTFYWKNPSASLLVKRVRRKAKRKKEGAFGETRSDRFCLCAAGVKKLAQRSVPRNQVQRVRVQHGKETAFQNHADAFAARAHGKPAARGHGRLSTQRVAEKKGGVGDLCLSASHGNVSGKVAREIGISPPGSVFRFGSATRTPSARARKRLRRARWSDRDQGYRRSARRRRRNRGRSR